MIKPSTYRIIPRDADQFFFQFLHQNILQNRARTDIQVILFIVDCVPYLSFFVYNHCIFIKENPWIRRESLFPSDAVGADWDGIRTCATVLDSMTMAGVGRIVKPFEKGV